MNAEAPRPKFWVLFPRVLFCVALVALGVLLFVPDTKDIQLGLFYICGAVVYHWLKSQGVYTAKSIVKSYVWLIPGFFFVVWGVLRLLGHVESLPFIK